LLLKIARKELPVSDDVLLTAYPELRQGSVAAAQAKHDEPRKNATTFATENLRTVMAETNSRIKEIDARLRELEAERETLYAQRELEFRKQMVAQWKVGDLM
jgi:hypothetical protein